MTLRLFLCGDVMTGRGIDQVLGHPSDPRLFEPAATSALDYVALAEREGASIPMGADDTYIWGDALAEISRYEPSVRIGNLETAVTTSDRPWQGKSVHYRMHPDNVGCLQAMGFDCCVLANNHVLDWGEAGLLETLDALEAGGVPTAGAGRDLEEASAPAVIEHAADGRVLVFAVGSATSGIPREWAARADRPGIRLLSDLSTGTAEALGDEIRERRRNGDLVVLSIHWGPNWGFDVPPLHRTFARRLIERAGVDLVYGHSSHHPMGIEVHRDRPILYGCGDFLNDYEGIGRHDGFGSDLALMYLPAFEAETRHLAGMRIVPFRIRGFRLERAGHDERRRVKEMLDREGRPLGTRARSATDGALSLDWEAGGGG